MNDLVEIPRPSSDVFNGWLSIKILSRIPERVFSPGTVVTVCHEPPNGYVQDISPNDLLQVSVKIRKDALGKEHRQIWGVHRALRPAEMKKQAEAFLHHLTQKVDCFNWDFPCPTVKTFDGGLNGGIELNVGKSEERGGIEQVLLITACLDLSGKVGEDGIAYAVENEGGNSEPRNPSFLGTLCRALEIFYSWKLYDAQQSFEKERE